MTGPRPWRRRLRIGLLVVVAAVLVLFPVATARLFVWPPTDQPVKADAVVALGGDPGQMRQKKAIALARAGFAPVAVISRGGVQPVPCPKPVPHVSIVCFRADPLDTRGEAEFVSRLVAARHWHRIIVVPERSQATRARLLFKRCASIQLVMDPVQDPRNVLPYAVFYEWGALAKAIVLEPSC